MTKNIFKYFMLNEKQTISSLHLVICIGTGGPETWSETRNSKDFGICL